MAASAVVRHRMKHQARTDPTAPRKSRFQRSCPSKRGQGGMQHASTSGGSSSERATSSAALPARRAEAAWCAGPAERDTVFRPGTDRHRIEGLAQAPASIPRFGRDEAEQESEWPPEIFRAGLDAMSMPALIRRKEERRRPGVVHDQCRAACMRGLAERRDVLHLEGVRARRFGEDDFRVRLHQGWRCRRR